MRALAVPTSTRSSPILLHGQCDADGVAVHHLDHRPQPDLDILVPAVLEGAINYLRSGQPNSRPKPRRC